MFASLFICLFGVGGVVIVFVAAATIAATLFDTIFERAREGERKTELISINNSCLLLLEIYFSFSNLKSMMQF